MRAAEQALFATYPLTGSVDLSVGPVPTPYHVYDGQGLLILGTCSLDRVEGVFAEQDVHPVLTASGRAILVLFLCDFRKASHGAHHEFHITALSAPTSGQRLSDDPAAALAALAAHHDWGVLSLHLWNDLPAVVAYNSEYLGLQASRCLSQLELEPRHMKVEVKDTKGATLIAGHLNRPAKSESGLGLRVLRHLGWRALWDVVRRRPARAHVINRKGPVIARNGRALTMTAPDEMVIFRFPSGKQTLTSPEGPLAGYGFVPQVAQYLAPFRFVYLHPDAGLDAAQE